LAGPISQTKRGIRTDQVDISPFMGGNVNRYDLITFGRAVGVSVGAGLLVSTIIHWLSPRRGKTLISAAMGVVVLLTVVISSLWRALPEVPRLDNLSADRAEQLLTGLTLVPAARPQHVTGVEPGRVIPNSQDPVAGLDVKPGTVVSYAVALRGDGPIPPPPPFPPPSVSLFEPRAGATCKCTRRPDGVGSIAARGTVRGIQSEAQALLLWLKPVRPLSEMSGWYLQRPPESGVAPIAGDGTWSGAAQLGNPQYPPQEGAVIDIAISVADHETASRLLAEAGVVTRNEPVGVVCATASGVVLTFK
jgi:hypothetical protein